MCRYVALSVKAHQTDSSSLPVYPESFSCIMFLIMAQGASHMICGYRTLEYRRYYLYQYFLK